MSHSKQIFQKLISSAIQAPSGENCQPWRFTIKEDSLEMYNIPERDNSLYSFGQMASYVAHGAAIENMAISASTIGYDLKIELFPDKSITNLVARIMAIENSSIKQDFLAPYIKDRVTNRKPYKITLLTKDDKNYLLSSVNEARGGHDFILIENRGAIADLAKLASINEQILFENRYLHNFFYSHINWTEEEDREKSIGFYIDTLELPPPAKKLFKLFKHWNILQIFNKVGISQFIAKQNADVYQSSGAIGAIKIDSDDEVSFINAGRLFEHIWLKATKIGWSLQPLNGILFLMLGIRHKWNVEQLRFEQIEMVKRCYKKISEICGVKEGTVILMFRIGFGDPPSAKSTRLEAEVNSKS